MQIILRPNQTHFHGDNTGSNPVADAKSSTISYFFIRLSSELGYVSMQRGQGKLSCGNSKLQSNGSNR